MIIGDYIRFRSVCKAWRCCTLPKPNHLPCQFPWLMLPQSGNNNCDHRQALFDLATNQIHFLDLPELYSKNRGLRVCGSSHGWLAIVGEFRFPLLFNPLAGAGEKFTLPRLDSIKKIYLSGTPGSGSGSNFVAVAVVGLWDELAYYKGNSNSWKYIEETNQVVDVTYFNGLFYALKQNGKIAVFDLSGDSLVVNLIHVLQSQTALGSPNRQYLVNSMGELLLVNRFLNCYGHMIEFGRLMSTKPYKTCSFRVFKLDFVHQKWEELLSLGDMVLFIGKFSSLAVKASDYHYPGCKLRNKIYFLNDYGKSVDDVGVFNLDDGSFDQLPCCLTNSNSRLQWPRPVWISPESLVL